MNERDPFLKALAENEDDIPTRLVFADWLDDNGEHEEADRQRKWPAAKEWLVRFCQKYGNEWDSEDSEYYPTYDYKRLLQAGREAVESGRYGWDCGANQTIQEALQENCAEFWKNWSIVTGIPLPSDLEKKSYFSCAC